jgi:hypothetical protein
MGSETRRRCSILQEYPITELANHANYHFTVNCRIFHGLEAIFVLHLETTKILGFKYCQHDEDAL